ncbi:MULTISPECIES: hypothetical protein [Actinomadura]|uniref:Uncharacterized protein n=1 Tax=Actinomadura madurae TaxID=1993 RepID=A0A1I5BU67_9ACTN|nr:hypothetical protein [Actinomadura madurae]SFN78319.1 hypothetical protein SAMN04489713_10328 [Actinomadura madurae]SPT50932.1 Uncharacterised protein [Actinomadura madurae]
MSSGDHTGVLPATRNDRRTHLDALRAAVELRPELAGGVVERRGVAWVSVVRVGGPRRTVEIGCDYVRSGWWFTWSDGRPIAPVGNVQSVVGRLVRELGVA